MPEAKKTVKKTPAPVAKDTKQAIDQAAQAAKVAGATFDKLKDHFEKKKVDEWQKKWLALPENRKKYEKITDAPEVIGEEAVALVNDIIDFAQGEETGKSHLFSKVKNSLGSVLGKVKGVTEAGVTEAKAQADKVAPTAKAPAKAKKVAKK